MVQDESRREASHDLEHRVEPLPGRSSGTCRHGGVSGGRRRNSEPDNQDRRAQRFLRSFRRSGRTGLVRRGSDGGGGFRQRGRRSQGRDRFRRPSEQARRRSFDRSPLDRAGGRRRRRDLANSGVGLAVNPYLHDRTARCSRPPPRLPTSRASSASRLRSNGPSTPGRWARRWAGRSPKIGGIILVFHQF